MQFHARLRAPLEEIRKIQAEIDVYLGLKEPPPTANEATATEWASVLRETPPAFGEGKHNG